MNFFEQQERARTQTTRLVFLFLLSVVSLIAITNLLIMFALAYSQHGQNMSLQVITNQFDWNLFATISIGTISFVLVASLIKASELSAGGKIVAEKLNGRLLLANTTDFHEKQLLNIVSEMAIASGLPVPAVYVIDENAINAFAAGFGVNDAIIGVTRGAMKNLNREELQGVIAHEFSHIFNGDMRLNLKLISILHGILVIGIMGYYILRICEGRSSRSKNGAALVMLGFGLMVIGYAGTFFGDLLKASVARKRESLADASAVQYTRNPGGISSALKKIGGYIYGSKLDNPNASEMSHMFFAEGTHGFLESLMATHPPLPKRILTIDPTWNGEFTVITKEDLEDQKITQDQDIEKQKKITSIASSVANMMQSVGVIDQGAVNKARNMIDSMSHISVLGEEINDRFGARAIIYSLFIVKGSDAAQDQIQIIYDYSDPQIVEKFYKLYEKVNEMDKKFRLTLIDLLSSALNQLTNEEYKDFKETVESLANADSKIDFFEWALMKILFNDLDKQFSKNNIEVKPIYKLSDVIIDASLFLSLMALTGSDDIYAAGKNLNMAMMNQNIFGISFFEKEKITIPKLDAAVQKLNQLLPMEKQKLLKAAVVCIAVDGVSFSEVEMLRAFSSSIGCPMPLL